MKRFCTTIMLLLTASVLAVGMLAMVLIRMPATAEGITVTDAHRSVTAEHNAMMSEAPMLAERVEQGLLPPVGQRLPVNPMVVPVVDQPGLYGGTWRKFETTPDFVSVRMITNYYPLARWNPEADGIIPGMAESWEFDDDGRVIRFRLREGLRWSDGEPFTSRDILFWWELCTDDRVSFAPPEWAYTNGKRMRVVAPDDQTIEFHYEDPFYFLPLVMATGFWTSEYVLIPAHYLKRFHPDHNPEYTDFNELVRKNNVVNNADRPTLGPWRLSYYADTGDRAVYERNPYYGAVDPEGRQLPYIDRIEAIRVQSPEAGVLYAMSGAVDAQFRQLDINDHTLLKRFEQKGGYRITTWEEGTAAWHAAFINWSPPGERRRILFRDQRFREALAISIDRQRINQVVWSGLARPQAAAITDESWHFKSERGQLVLEEWIRKWSQYDPQSADALLDSAGLNERDGEGMRMFDGEPFQIELDYFDMPYAAEQAAMIQEDWRRVGLRVVPRRASSTDLWTRITNGDYDIYMQHNSELDLFTFPGYVFPTDAKTWHPRVGRWYTTGGREGEAPRGFMVKLLDLYEQAKAEQDLEKRHGLVLDAIQIQLDHGPFMIGTTGRQKSIVLLSEHIRNVPSSGVMGPWAQCQPGSKFPEQFFFDQARLYGEVR